uniref:Uncharacterized protein n=1 Tax=Arundo donax TaxID=35708 RepID=A0A0A9H7T2_ARUDO
MRGKTTSSASTPLQAFATSTTPKEDVPEPGLAAAAFLVINGDPSDVIVVAPTNCLTNCSSSDVSVLVSARVPSAVSTPPPTSTLITNTQSPMALSLMSLVHASLGAHQVLGEMPKGYSVFSSGNISMLASKSVFTAVLTSSMTTTALGVATFLKEPVLHNVTQITIYLGVVTITFAIKRRPKGDRVLRFDHHHGRHSVWMVGLLHDGVLVCSGSHHGNHLIQRRSWGSYTVFMEQSKALVEWQLLDLCCGIAPSNFCSRSSVVSSCRCWLQ